jgi:hypothetical protein
MTDVAGRAAGIVQVLRGLRRGRRSGAISEEDYEAALDALDPPGSGASPGEAEGDAGPGPPPP